MSHYLAPNGKPSNLTHEQWHLVRTPEFKAWFGDWENDPANASKVVDENSEPLVVYHGTYLYQDAYTILNKITYFTDNRITAEKYPIDGYVYFKTFDDYADEFNIDENDIKKLSEYYDIDKIKRGSILVREDDSFEIWKGFDPNKLYVYECFLNFKSPKVVNAKEEDLTYINNDNDNRVIEYKNEDYDSIIGIYPYRWFSQDKIDYDAGKRNIYKEEKHFITFNSNQIKLADGTNTTFDGSNPDIRYDDGGRVEDLIGEGIVDLKMYDTTPEHAKEYGLQSINPLYIQTICVSEPKRLKGLGKKVLAYIEKYAIENGHDVVFGHITQKAKFTKDERETFFCDIDMIKNWLHSNGYAINDNNNDFHKVISYSNPDIRYNNGGTMKKVDKGGITYGKSHDDGGIPVKNASTGQMLEVEGGEGIVNKRSMASDKKVKMNGKEMTICEAVSQLNQMEGGVKFSCDDVEHRQFIEAMELGGELERGVRTEKEHIETLRKLYENRLTPTEAVTSIAKEHIAESPTYYTDLENMNRSATALGMSTDALSNMIFDFQAKRVADRANVSSFETADSKVEDIREYEDGGMFGRTCGCKNHKRKYLDGGMFDSGFGSLDNFIGQSAKKEETKKDAEYSLEVIDKARKLLDKDYLQMILSSSMSPKYKIYFQHLKKLNLYQEGWRFKFGQSREWAGLCAYKGLVFDKSKTLYLSINFVKHDENWLENEKDTILHEMAHAIVDEYMITKVIDFLSVDPAHKVNEGHGEAWEQVCKAINPEGNCGRFYNNAKLKDSFLPYMYECGFCSTKKYSRNRNFTNVCFKCMKPVIVTKND